MTDSRQAKQPTPYPPTSIGVPPADKRARLIEGARLMLHEQGVERTTIADVAGAADVPVGNVYYYFKTKDDLLAAAIDAHAADVRAALASLGRHRTPRARLKAFVRMIASQGELVSRYGCPHGTLCSELDKREAGQAGHAATLMQIPIDWAAEQFRAMGRRDAGELAITLMAAYQGISLLTNTFRDASLMSAEARRLERWIDSLA